MFVAKTLKAPESLGDTRSPRVPGEDQLERANWPSRVAVNGCPMITPDDTLALSSWALHRSVGEVWVPQLRAEASRKTKQKMHPGGRRPETTADGRQREATGGNERQWGGNGEARRGPPIPERLPPSPVLSRIYTYIYRTLTAELFREGFPVLSVLRFGKQILVREMPIPLLVLRRASFAELEI